jgi:Mn2+/Fe2+ NRAMP family transporter
MKKLLSLTLGIMTALGGFIDLGQIVFTMQSGALFDYRLAWPIGLGTIVIIAYMEMCGRVAVVAREPVFSIVRTRFGFRTGLVILILSNLLNVITGAAELGGIAIILHLLTGWPQIPLLIGATLLIVGLTLAVQFKWLERIFGLSGLLMIVFALAAIALHPDGMGLLHGLIPTVPRTDSKHLLLYSYFAVGLFSALLTEYQVHFYSSAAIEEDWKVEDLGTNLLVASVGSSLGGVLTLALLALGALVFLPNSIFPQLLSTTAMAGALPFGHKTLVVVLLGILACLSGATVETLLSGAYNACQFFNRPWGKSRPPKSVPLYTAAWIGMFGIALLIAVTGVQPLQLVDISIIFGMVVMPWTYYPILRAAADSQLMGRHVNSPIYTALATLFLVLICVAAVAAIPLLMMTRGGQP